MLNPNFELPSYIARMGRRTGKMVKKKDAKIGFDGYYDAKDYFESFTTGRSPDTSVMPSSLENKTEKNNTADSLLDFINDSEEEEENKNVEADNLSLFQRKSSKKLISSIKKQEEKPSDTSEKKLYEVLSQNPIFSSLLHSQKKLGREAPIFDDRSEDSIGKEIKDLQEKYQIHLSTVKTTSYAILEEGETNVFEKKSKKMEGNDQNYRENNKQFEKNDKNEKKSKKEKNEIIEKNDKMEKKEKMENIGKNSKINNNEKNTNNEKKEVTKKNEKLDGNNKKELDHKNEQKEEKKQKKGFGGPDFVNAEKFMQLNKDLESLLEIQDKKKQKDQQKPAENIIIEDENPEKIVKKQNNKEKQNPAEKIVNEEENQEKDVPILKKKLIPSKEKSQEEIKEETQEVNVSKKRLIKTKEKKQEEKNHIQDVKNEDNIIEQPENFEIQNENEEKSPEKPKKNAKNKKNQKPEGKNIEKQPPKNENPKKPQVLDKNKKRSKTVKNSKVIEQIDKPNDIKNDIFQENLSQNHQKNQENNIENKDQEENYMENIFFSSGTEENKKNDDKTQKNSKPKTSNNEPNKNKRSKTSKSKVTNENTKDLLQAYEKAMGYNSSKSRVMKEITKEKESYGENNRYPMRMRVPTLCYWKPISLDMEKTADGRKILKIREEDVFMMGLVAPVKKIRIGHDGKAKKIENKKTEKNKEDEVNKTVNYEIISNDYESFTALIGLNVEQKKDFGQNKFGPIQCSVLKSERNKLKAEVGNRELTLSVGDKFVIETGQHYSMYNKSKMSKVEISCKVIK